MLRMYVGNVNTCTSLGLIHLIILLASNNMGCRGLALEEDRFGAHLIHSHCSTFRMAANSISDTLVRNSSTGRQSSICLEHAHSVQQFWLSTYNHIYTKAILSQFDWSIPRCLNSIVYARKLVHVKTCPN